MDDGPPRSVTLGALVLELAERCPGTTAIRSGGVSVTYLELAEQVRVLAEGLLGLGVRAGDQVAVWLPNCVEWVVSHLAVASVGAVTVGANTWYRAPELEYALQHSSARVLIMTDRFLRNDNAALLAEVAPEVLEPVPPGGRLRAAGLPDLEHVVCLRGADRVPAARSWEQLVEAGAGVPDGALDAARAAVQPADTAQLLYTSGSTAHPKGVLLAHGHLIANGYGIGSRQHVTGEDRVWLANPLFFSYGCANALMVVLSAGCTLVLQEVFDATRALEVLSDERCTVLYGTTNMAVAMRAHPDRARYDLSSLRTGTAIGSPAQVQLRVDLGATRICNIYGLTETYGNCCVTDADEPLEVRLVSQGPPLPGNELRIVDPATGEVLPAGEVGEIRVRGHVTSGYHRDPERTRESFDADGFFRTGDLGLLDAAGRVHWQGRSTEMLKTGGINVAPVEVEEVLLQHPAVEEAVVVGLPDEAHDELVTAFVSLRSGAALSEGELVAFCRSRLASYKVPRRTVFLATADFPLTSTGKVWRRELRDRFLAQEAAGAAPDPR